MNKSANASTEFIIDLLFPKVQSTIGSKVEITSLQFNIPPFFLNGVNRLAGTVSCYTTGPGVNTIFLLFSSS